MRGFACAVVAAVVLAGCGRASPSSAVASVPAASSSSAPASSAAAASSSAAGTPPPRPVSVDMATTIPGTVTGTPPPALSGGLAFATARDGLAALNAGGVLATSDGGRSWSVLDPGGQRFSVLTYPTSGRAYGLTFGNVLWASADGGHTWSQVRAFPPSTAAFSQGLDFTGADVGWVAVGATLYTTADGGGQWASHPAPCPAGFSAGPVDAAHGYLLCVGEPSGGAQDKVLYATADGGATWHRVVPAASAAPVMGTGSASDLVFVSSNVGYLSADRGGLFRTDDGGRTFHQLLRSDGADEMAWPSAAVGYVAANGAVVATDDGGTTWRQVYPALAPTRSVVFTGAEHGIGLGTNWDPQAVMATADGGHTWTMVGRVSALRLALAPSGVVWAYGSGLFRSTDFGRTWTAVTQIPPPGGGALEGLTFPSAEVGFAEDNRGQMFRTRDGGRLWAPLPPSPVPGGSSLAFATSHKGWAFAGAAGSWETADAGKTWRPSVGWMPAPSFGGFADGARGWALGVHGCAAASCAGDVLLSTDGGSSWKAIAFTAPESAAAPSFAGCTALDFPSPQVGYAVLDGLLYHSANGGVTWRLLDG